MLNFLEKRVYNTSILLAFLMISCGQDAYRNNQAIRISMDYFSGIIHDNDSNKERQGSGFNPLVHYLYPKQNLYRDDAVGLNFEHIMNGTAKDADICMFTPRRDICFVRRNKENSVSIIHEAQHSSWNMDSEMKYTFTGEYSIDMEFEVIIREDRFPLDYVAFMWASYMNCALDRRIYFIGCNEAEEGWITFGEDSKDGFETGTIGYNGVDPLPYENGTKTLNIIENLRKKFILPFYYGLVHGSGNTACDDDTMAYIMMFDQRESIRFALWNFFLNSDGIPDIHSPAWDWQFVIRAPKTGKKYGYQARVVYKPFAGRRDIEEEYANWIDKISQK